MATKLDPRLAAAFFSWGNVLAEQKRYDEAIARYQAATEIDPKFAAAYANWGRALNAEGKFREAQRQFDKASRFASK
jgi:tetratricopeptide (TPR) repeat protein